MGASKRALHSQMELAELRAAQKAQATQLQRAYDPASLTGADCLIGWCEMRHSSPCVLPLWPRVRCSLGGRSERAVRLIGK
jgi:hypothetical protein